MQQNKAVTREKQIYTILYSLLLIIWGVNFFTKFGFSYYKELWHITLTMVFGSFIGGFTSEGGGAVAFPVFTKVLHISPYVARDFSFAVQSIGMSFASITIFLRKIPIEKNIIKYAAIGGIIGIVVGSFCIVPNVLPADARLIFTVVLTSFGIALFIKNFVMKTSEYDKIMDFQMRDAIILLLIGFIGGLFSSIIGTGIHFITFSIVTLLYKLNEKIATPTSVIIMALDSIFGFAFRGLIIGEYSQQAITYWMLCIPIVAFFAPMGARICSRVSRLFVVRFLLLLISVEFISTLVIYKFSVFTAILSILFIITSLLVYLLLIRVSGRLVRNI